MAPRSLCPTTAFAPAPGFLGGSCPLGCSLSAPATGGLSLWLARSAHVCGRLREREGGRRLTSWGYYSTICSYFARGGWQWGLATPASGRRGGRMVLSWRAPCFIWLGVRGYPARTTLRRFWKQGDSPCTPGGGAAPCTPLGGRGASLRWRVWALASLPPGTGGSEGEGGAGARGVPLCCLGALGPPS